MGDVLPIRAELPEDEDNVTPRTVASGVEAILEVLRHGTLELQRELPWSSEYFPWAPSAGRGDGEGGL